MGCFDSLYVDCPKCNGSIEFQSKSGYCAMSIYNRDNLPVEVAVGMQGDIEKCEACGQEVKLNCMLQEFANVRIESI